LFWCLSSLWAALFVWFFLFLFFILFFFNVVGSVYILKFVPARVLFSSFLAFCSYFLKAVGFLVCYVGWSVILFG